MFYNTKYMQELNTKTY